MCGHVCVCLCVCVSTWHRCLSLLRYFFPANVLVHMEGDGVEDHLDNQEQFVAIMNMYIQSFMQPDIALFKQNLGALQELHQRHKLFSKVCPV